jgi:predicted ATP-grasp superfamily ATP-dependent carboligase
LNHSKTITDAPWACLIGDISMVRALGKSKIPVAVASSDINAKGCRSRYCREVILIPDGRGKPRLVVDTLLEWGRKQKGRSVLFYQGDEDLLMVSRNRHRLAESFRFVLPAPELVENLVHKVRFYDLATTVGLPVPQTAELRTDRSINLVLREWNVFPCVLKPILRTQNWHAGIQGNNKAIYIQDWRALELWLKRLKATHQEVVAQFAVPGGEENILSYHAYVRESGIIAAEFTGRKIRTSPRKFGRSTYLEITDDEEICDLGREIIDKISFTGVLKIDFKRDAIDNKVYVLEINPRFNLWHHPATVAGVSIPEAVYWDCVEPGNSLDYSRVETGVRWMVPRSDNRSFEEYKVNEKLTRRRWLYQVGTAAVNEGFQVSDPLPAILDLADILKSKIARQH